MAFDLLIYYNFISRPFTILRRFTRKGLTTPLTRRVARCCYFCAGAVYVVFAWFSYWFDNHGFFTEGNTYRRSAASSLPLWGNTDIVLVDIKRNFLASLPGRIFNINQVPNRKSHLLATYIICHLPLVFLSPTSPLPFIRPLFSVRPFLACLFVSRVPSW